MLFNSFEFLVFFPIFFVLYWFVFNKSLKLQNLLILAGSYIFYGWWSWKFLGLLALSTLLDYLYGLLVESSSPKRAKLFLWLSILNNLGILAVFKYYDFFALQFASVLSQIGFAANPLILDLVLPVGISFYTFHGMSYVFDIYKGERPATKSIIDYAVFVSFFPLLVAGPIERANHLLPQIQHPRSFNYTNAVEGARLILWGLFKKIVIADTLAPHVDFVFQNSSTLNGFYLFAGAIAFAFQIYGDFSGYSDIAIGISKLLGFELLTNFKFPYFSRDIAEFWRRWHISLSSWFRDYLYIPLGGSKNGKATAVRNTFIIFLVSGFWHGASWNFIIWGMIHALGFLPLLLLEKNRVHVGHVVAETTAMPTIKETYQMLKTFLLVTLAWIFFREPSFFKSLEYCSGIFTRSWQFIPSDIYRVEVVLILLMLIIEWRHRRDSRKLYFSKNRLLRSTIYLGLLVLIVSFFFQNTNNSFIYFQF